MTASQGVFGAGFDGAGAGVDGAAPPLGGAEPDGAPEAGAPAFGTLMSILVFDVRCSPPPNTNHAMIPSRMRTITAHTSPDPPDPDPEPPEGC